MIEKEENRIRFAGIASDCFGCVLNQARSAARFADLSREQTELVVACAETWLERSRTQPLLVQHIVRYVEDEVIRQCGKSTGFDIYADVKKESNDRALAYVDRCRSRMAAADDPLAIGLQMAAAGNIIDFGAKDHTSIDIDQELRDLTRSAFFRYDFETFQRGLNTASFLLYICDNCGEIVFDMLFMQYLQKIFPDLEIVAAVRAKPVINDATLADARDIGLDRYVRIISSGSVYPGTVMAETTSEFRNLFETADVILAKGQGNFETLLPLNDARLFFLLRIKCEYMASLAGAQKGSLVLMQGGGPAAGS